MSESNHKHETRTIKRTTWLDVFRPEKEVIEVLGNNFDNFKEEASLLGSTAEIVRKLNLLANDVEVTKKERLAWYKIKDFIFEQAILNKDEHGSILLSPNDIDAYTTSSRNKSRIGKGYDNWSGTQKGIYLRPIVEMPKTLMDTRPTDEQVKDLEKFEKLPRTERPGNFEDFIYNRLREIKNIKSGPVVFVDFGGVQSLTTLRTALKFKDEIKRGEIVFVVTNLAADKDEVISYIKRAKYGAEEKWILEAMDYVHYVQADAVELAELKITLPNNEEININGNIDFLHESSSITPHGLANDRDFDILGTALSDYGLIATSRNVVHGDAPIDSTVMDIKSMQELSFADRSAYEGVNGHVEGSRKKSLRYNWTTVKKQRAYRNLTEELGLVNIDALPLKGGKAYPLSYSFFVKPTAPDLAFVDKYNNKITIKIGGEARLSKLKEFDEHTVVEAWREEQNRKN